ncbi:MAG TPA: Hsp20/alpha crystallin family protein [Opitutaceae bacterium]
MSFLNTLIPTRNGSCSEAGAVQTRRPQYEVSETESTYDLTVYLPGVSKDGLEITDEDGELTISGKSTSRLPEGLTLLHRESPDAAFSLVVTHDNTVDSGKIVAELKDGVLQLKLAKAESAKPRKITVA